MNGGFGEITKIKGHLGNVKQGVEGYCWIFYIKTMKYKLRIDF